MLQRTFFHTISCCCLLLILGSTTAQAAIKSAQPPYALTLEQLKNWRPDGPFASSDNISIVALGRRTIAPLSAQRAQLDHEVKVLYAPDGMNNFANYVNTQYRFNLYNFTHWSQIDVLNWFGGTADKTVQIPARPWVETAHRNGVKVIGSVFFAIAQYGGNAATLDDFLNQDEQGRFIYADRLIEVANYYGFDGWLINQETDLTFVKDRQGRLIPGRTDTARGNALGQRMLAFMKYLTASAPQNMEIHWYDAMLADGRIAWQNELNQANEAFFHDGVRTADAMFINYWWDQSMVQNSHARAVLLNRSPYDLYFGADLWPARNAQQAFSEFHWLTWLFNERGTKALTSIALFAPNLNYNFPSQPDVPAFSQFDTEAEDFASFYATEERLFNGNDFNLALDDPEGWPGIGRYVPAKSTINRLPLVTNFNTGQGKVFNEGGKRVHGPWTNMALQDLLPTWQFAVYGSKTVRAAYDFDRVFSGGSSLRVAGKVENGVTQIPLYHTDFHLGKASVLTLVFSGTPNVLSLYLEYSNGERKRFKLLPEMAIGDNWFEKQYDLQKYAGAHVTKIGLLHDGKALGDFSVNLGQLKILQPGL